MPKNEKPQITVEDIVRVLGETELIDDGDDWLEKENVDMEAIQELVKGATEAFVTGIMDGKPINHQFAECIANAFITGWDCGRELGRSSFKREVEDETHSE